MERAMQSMTSAQQQRDRRTGLSIAGTSGCSWLQAVTRQRCVHWCNLHWALSRRSSSSPSPSISPMSAELQSIPKESDGQLVAPGLIAAAKLPAALERCIVRFLPLRDLFVLHRVSKPSRVLAAGALKALSSFTWSDHYKMPETRALELLSQFDRLTFLDVEHHSSALLGDNTALLAAVVARNAASLRRVLVPAWLMTMEILAALCACKNLTSFSDVGLRKLSSVSDQAYSDLVLKLFDSCPAVSSFWAQASREFGSPSITSDALLNILSTERASLRSLTFRPLGADFAAALARQTALESLSVRVSLQGTALRATLNALGQSLAALPTLFKFTMNIESEDDDLRSESLVPWRLPPSLTSLSCVRGVLPPIASAPGLRDLRHRVRLDGAALEAAKDSLRTLVIASPEALSEQDCRQLFRCSLLTKLTTRGALPVQCLQQLPGALCKLTQLSCAVGTTTQAAAAVATRIVLGLPQLERLQLSLRLDEDFDARWKLMVDETAALKGAATPAWASAAAAARAEAKGDAKLESVSAPRLRKLFLGACDDSLFQRCRFPALEELSFSGQGVRLENWAALGAACPRLRRLDVFSVPGVNDKAVCAALLGVRESLQQLTLYDLSLVGAGTLQFLQGAETALPLLRSLDVSGLAAGHDKAAFAEVPLRKG